MRTPNKPDWTEIVIRLLLPEEAAEAGPVEAVEAGAPGSRIDVKPVLSYSKENRFPEGRMRSRGCKKRKIESRLVNSKNTQILGLIHVHSLLPNP